MSLSRQLLPAAAVVAAVLVAMPLMGSTAPGPTVIFVDDDNCPGPGSGSQADPYCSIQTAIDNAVDTDEVLVAPGTYFETINFLGKAITVRSTDPNDAVVVLNTIINGGGSGSVVTCISGEGADTVLDGFTLTGGTGTDPGDGFTHGGGMYNVGSSPTVINCTFSGNTATNDGGGMFNDNSSPTVTDCIFSGNTAARLGGGMFNFASSSPTVINCMFSENMAVGGGGMRNVASSPTVTNCTFSGNSATDGFGGGMCSIFGSPNVTNCTFSGNTATNNGGGMFNFVSSPTVTNCTFSGNSTSRNGGGMYNGGSSPTVTNCTFSGNSATDGFGGGMLNFGSSSPTVTNCILWDDDPDEVFGPATVAYSNVEGVPGIGNIDADPLFVDADNGDFRLSPGSPCIDAGDNTAVPLEITTDLDGNPRFVDDPATPDTGNGEPPIVDMGAYEADPCPWDLNGDGNVFVTDLLLLLGDFGSCAGSPADFDGDGCVGVPDLLALIANFGPCPGSECVWDVNGDGFVDNDDLQQVLDNFGPCDGCPEDVNGDGIVNGLDAAAVATHFGLCP